MSLIEKAAVRLEQLRRAGIDVDGAERREPVVGGGAPADDDGYVVPAQGAVEAANRREVHAVELPPAPRRDDGATESKEIQIDLARLAAAGVVTPNGSRSMVADEFRVIKRPLIANATGKSAAPVRDGNLIMVTSALPGEGKSFTAVNLAMSIAMELDHTVLLVDADVARPSLPRLMGYPQSRGLLDVLVDEATDLRDVLLRTNVEKLTILPSGTPHPRATELLASESMNQLLAQMSSRYSDRVIVFDSPPLLVTTEARVLATHMGQIVMVVEAQRTAQTAVKQALAAIEACPVKMMLLNKRRAATTGDPYSYGYGYGYGYGAQS